MIPRTLFLWFFALCIGARAYAYTEAEYYNAGLRFFTAKDYLQAIQYFSAALGLDPHNSPALRGRADGYYELGRYREALDDYEKVMAMKPADETVMELGPPDPLPQIIQALRAKIASGAPGLEAASGPPASRAGPAIFDAFSIGTLLFLQKNYTGALPYFRQAAGENPNDSKAYYFLGATELRLGDNKNAVVALTLCAELNPNPPLEAYVRRLKSGLSSADREWVNVQVKAVKNSKPGKEPSHPPKRFGVRLIPDAAWAGPGPFDTNAQALRSDITQLQSSDSSLTYNAVVPGGGPDVGMEPVLRLGNHFEIGLPLAFSPLGTVKDSVNDSNGDSYADSYGIQAWAAGLNVRYLLGSGSLRPFLSLRGFLAFMTLDYLSTFDFADLSSGSASGSFSGLGFGGQAQLGLDWHLGETFIFSPFIGYQLASVGSWNGTLDSGSAGISGQKGQLVTIPTKGGRVIALVSNGTLAVPVFTDAGVLLPGTAAPAGTQPLGLDFSGFKAGLQISAFF